MEYAVTAACRWGEAVMRPSECRECGSGLLTWQTVNRIHLGCTVQPGRLMTSDVVCLFVLGCDECSETLMVVEADGIAKFMNTEAQAND